MSLKDALEYAKAAECILIPYEKAEGMDAARKLLTEISNKGSVAVFIGPEGGFEEKEIALAGGNGAHPITLGKRILRTETAGLCILSVLMMNAE